MTQINLGNKVTLGFHGSSAALDYARWLLRGMGAKIIEIEQSDFAVDFPVLMAGTTSPAAQADLKRAPLIVQLWDFHVGRAGKPVLRGKLLELEYRQRLRSNRRARIF